MTDKILILTTVASANEAKKIADALVERRLAACVNIVPKVQSVFRWEGKVESSEEHLLLIKTVKNNQEAVQSAIRDLHSYDLPEFIALTIDSGSAEYLDWIEQSVKEGS